MTVWYSGFGWDWCSMTLNVLAVVVFWVLPGPKALVRRALPNAQWTTTNFAAD